MVFATTAGGALPVPDAIVEVARNGEMLYTLETNVVGETSPVTLDAPDVSNTLEPGRVAYSTYDVLVTKPGFTPVRINDVQVFDGIESIQNVTLLPETESQSLARTRVEYVEVNIPPSALITQESPVPPPEEEIPEGKGRIAREVYIPEFITVHLGTPDSAAANVTVPFIDYVKNVASSEIYPTWPESALYANMHAQISLVLNRVYTEWYRSRGYPFDITNSTRYDQAFVYGRNIFDSVSRIADDIFNTYIQKGNSKAPFFAEYCNGTSATCNGLKQWGTVPLAEAGRTPLEILRYYYGNVNILSTDNIRGIQESYPGAPLTVGDNSVYTKTIQTQLNRIRQNFPLIPAIANVNGVYGEDTRAAVRAFQQVFSLPVTGVVDRATWNKISFLYAAVKKLAELDSEAIEDVVIGNVPTAVLRFGASGLPVKELQYLLNYIGIYYPGIPSVAESGTFGNDTLQAVKAFQGLFGLTADGIVGPTTWNKLFDVYRGLVQNSGDTSAPLPPTPPPTPEPPPPTPPTPPSGGKPPYPGAPLKQGSRGDNVKLVQEYLNALSTRYISIPKLTADGAFGPATFNAVVTFQRLFGLVPDGIIGPATWTALVNEYDRLFGSGSGGGTGGGGTGGGIEVRPYPGKALRRGDNNANVQYMQQLLNRLAKKYTAIPVVEAVGLFGPLTESAVKNFQRLFGLTADGIIGPATWNAVIREAQKL